MEREYVSKFTNSVILLSKLFSATEDRFLKQKLHRKLTYFVFAFLEQYSISREHRFHNVISATKSDNTVQCEHVAQCQDKALLNSINSLLDYLDYLAYISKGNATPLFLAQRNLLKLKLHILRQNKKEKTERPITNAKFAFNERERDSSVQRKKNFGMGTTNKERIFNYIKKTPDVRTKEIMSEFSALSGRTVKRSLKELLDEGFLRKRSDGAAVYYTCG